MAAFECDRCGRCCVSLGAHIIIERQLSDRDYYCSSRIDNTHFSVAVEPAFRDEIADAYESGFGNVQSENPACRFLRRNPDGNTTSCAIYATRPKVCRDFRCYRMLIRNQEGVVCGRVVGKTTLKTTDSLLENLWNERIASLPYGNGTAWNETVQKILAGSGYRADPVE
ncbi:MAG: YkgJ family cysteine cluster protein [Methanomicrobiales archaeon]|nr:YkgJ family cysteine cluster protein [Methanomicrobiales archaeon]